MKHIFTRSILLFVALILSGGIQLNAQNAIVGSGFSTGWGGGSCPTGNGNFSYFSASAGGTWINTRNANGTGNQFWRFGIDWGGVTAHRTQVIGSDVDVVPGTTYTLNPNCTTSGAIRYNVPSTSHNYVFKTLNAGTNPTGTWVFFEVQGAVRTPNTVAQLPTSGNVSPHAEVTVSVTMSGTQSTGQNVYIRYTNNNYATSTVASMTYSGSTATATIPAAFNTPGANISYYIFTSGPSNVNTDGSNTDLYTINLNNNGGSNYTYTVGSGWTTAAAGNWSDGATWTAGVTPPTTLSMGAVTINHNVTGNADALYSSLNVNGSNTLTQNTGIIHTAIGGVTINGTATYTVNGTLRLNAGGFVNTSGTLNYGSASTLQYNTGAPYGAFGEWRANVSSGSGVPQNVLISNNTALNFGSSNQFRQVLGNVDINAGSGFTLSSAAGGDLRIGGNIINTGGFTNNGRRVTYNGTIAQTVSSAAITFTGLTIANTSANVTAGANITVSSGGNLVIDANARLDMGTHALTITGITSSINGFLRSAVASTTPITGASALTLTFNSGGTFESNAPMAASALTGLGIPIATWNTGSTCAIIGLTNPSAGGWFGAGAAQTFSNFTWNCTSQTTAPNMGGATLTASGTFSMLSTGTSELRLGTATSGTIQTLNFVQSGGTINFAAGAGIGTLNCTGTFTRTGGTFTESSSGSGNVNFTGTAAQSITMTGGTVLNTINFRVNNAAGISITNGSTLPINATATFFRTNGAITLVGTGAIVYNATNSRLTYNGTSAITTSDSEFPNTNGPVNLTIDNTAGVTLHASKSLPASGIITFTNGRFIMGANNFTLTNPALAAVAGTLNSSNMAVAAGTGQFIRAINTATFGNRVWPIGDASGNYTPVALNFSANSANRNIGFNVVAGNHPQLNTPDTQVDYISRYWRASNSNLSGTYTYTGTFTHVAGDFVGTTPANMRVNQWNGSGWVQVTSTSAANVLSISPAVNQTTLPIGATAEFTGRRTAPASYVWQPTSTGPHDWQTASNWSPNRINPQTDDILVFSQGGNSIANNIPTQTIGKFIMSGNTTVNLVHDASASTLTISGGSGTDLDIPANCALFIGNASSTLAFNMNYSGTGHATSIAGTLSIGQNAFSNTYTVTNSTHSVAGSLILNGANSTIAGGTAANLIINSGGVYQHARTAGVVPTATWEDGSLCLITGAVATGPTGLGQNFWNITWNCTGQTGTIGMTVTNNPTRVRNKFTLASSNGAIFTMEGINRNWTATAGDIGDMDITGNSRLWLLRTALTTSTLIVRNLNVASTSTSSAIQINNSSAGTSTSTLRAIGNVELNCASGPSVTWGNLSGMTNIFEIGGNLTHTAGGLVGGVTSSNRLNFINAGTKVLSTFNNLSVTLTQLNVNGGLLQLSSGNINSTAPINIATGAGIQFGATTIANNTGTFTLNSGASLITANAGGIASAGATGSVQSSGARTFNAAANYTFNGTTAQITGTGFTGGANVTFDNTAGISLSASATVSTSITLTNGKVDLGAFDLVLTSNVLANLSGFSSSNYFVTSGAGEFRRAMLGVVTYDLPVGDATNYTPVSLAFSANATNRQIGARVVNSAHPFNSPSVDFASRYWALSNSVATGTFSFVPTFTFVNPGDVTGNTANFSVNRWGGTSWTEFASTSTPPTVATSVTINQSSIVNAGTNEFALRLNPPFIDYVWEGNTSNNWNTNTNWNPVGIPGSGDNVTIDDASINPCVINTGTFGVNNFILNGTGNFQMASGTQLTIAGDITYVNTASATFDCSSTLIVSSISSQAIPAFNYGSLNLSGGDRVLASTGVIGICGAFTPGAGSYTITGSTIDYNGTGAQTVSVFNYNNLTISGARTTNNISLASGIVGVAGVFNPSASFTTGNYVVTGNTVNYNGANGQTIAAFNYNNLTSTNNDRILQGSGNIGIAGAFTPGTGTYTTAGSTVVYNGTIAQTVVNFTSVTANRSYHNLIIEGTGLYTPTRTWPVGAGTFGITGDMTLNGGDFRQTTTNGGVNFFIDGDLNLQSSDARFTQHTGNLSTNQTYIIGDFNQTGGRFDFAVGSGTGSGFCYLRGNHTASGGLWNTASISAPNGVLVMNNPGTQTYSRTGGGINFVNVTILSGGTTLQLASNILVQDGNLAVGVGSVLDAQNFTATVSRSSGTRTFNLNSNSTLRTARAGGVAGTISLVGGATANYNTAANFEFTGTSQVTGFNTTPVINTVGGIIWSGTTAIDLDRTIAVTNQFNFNNNGLFRLGNFNLTLSIPSTLVGSPFSVSKMFVTNGTGQLIVNFTNPTAETFTWPIGEETGTTEYSPATLTLTATLNGGVGFRVIDDVHPQNAPATTFLSRYWVSSTTFSNYSWTGNFNYLPADINGPEASLKLNIHQPAPPTDGWIEYPSSSAASNVLTVTGGPGVGSLAGTSITGRVNLPLYYRTVFGGSWGIASNWEVADNLGFVGAVPATVRPNNVNSNGIFIRNTHAIVIGETIVADDLVIETGGTLSIHVGGNLTIANGAAATDFLIDGTFNVQQPLTLESGSETILNGLWTNIYAPFTNNGLGNATVNSTGTYLHNVNGGTVLTATWNPGSTLRIEGITTNPPGLLNQALHHVEWNSAMTQNVNLTQAQPFNTINGNLTVNNTGGFDLRMYSGNTGGTTTINGNVVINNNSRLIAAAGAAVNTATVNINIGGNLTINSGHFGTAGNTNTSALNATLNIGGNLILDNGNLNFNPGTFVIPVNHTVNLSGDLNITGTGQILRTSNLTSSIFRFNRLLGTQSISSTAGGLNASPIVWQIGDGTTQPTLAMSQNMALNASSSLTVNANATLDCQTFIVSGGVFNLTAASAAIRIGSPLGISSSGATGNIQTTTRNFGSARYYYTASVDQITGNGLPIFPGGTVNILGINTTAGARVSLNTTNHVTVNNMLDLVSGILILNAFDVQLAPTASIGGAPFSTSNMVVTTGTSRYTGRLMKLFPSGSFTLSSNFTYPLGDIDGTVEYSPVILTSLSYTGASSIPYLALKCKDAKHPGDPSVNDFLTRHWESTANWYSASGTLNKQLNYVAADIVGNEAVLKHNRFVIATATFIEDAGSSAAANVLTSETLPLASVIDHDHLGRLTAPIYFRSNVASGNWEDVNSWLASTDINFVTPPGVVPSVFPFASNSEQIRILTGHTIINNTTFLPIDQSIIDDGGQLTLNPASSIAILNGPGTDLQVDGTLSRINTGSVSALGLQPTYGATGVLEYVSGTVTPGQEWTGNSVTPGLGVPNDVVIQSATVNMPATARGIAGDLIINGGSFVLNSTLGADLSVAGNWTRINSSTFIPNNRAVFFNGGANQTMTITGGGTEAIPFVFINKTGGDFILNNSPATDLNVNGVSGGSIFQISGGTNFNINGNALGFNGIGTGNINTDGGLNSFIGGAGSRVNISGGSKTVTSSAGGSFDFGVDVTVNLTNGLNFGASLSTLRGILSINAGGFVSTNPPIYADNSTLRYSTAGTYGVGSEWTSTTDGVAAFGRPHHVFVQSSTVNMPASTRAMAGNLTISSSMNMNGGSGDLILRGDFTNNGTFNANQRQVSFTGPSAAQVIGGSAVTAFDFLEVNNANGIDLGNVTTVDDRILFTNGQIRLNNFNLTHNRNFTPAYQGASTTNYLVTNGTGRLVQTVNNTNIDFPIGPNSTTYNPLTLNQSGSADVISVLVRTAPAFTFAVNDDNQMVGVEYSISENVPGGNNLFTGFQWNASNEAAGFLRNSGVYHGFWNGTDWLVRPSNPTVGTDPYVSSSTVNFTGNLNNATFVVGNLNGILSCISSANNGNWNAPSTWVPGLVPPSDASVCVSHNIAVSGGNAEVLTLTVNPGGNVNIDVANTLTLSDFGGIVNNTGAVASLGAGSVIFNGVGSIAGTNGVNIANMTVNGNTTLSAATTISGNLTLNTGSFIIVGSPIYTGTSNLIYNNSGSYNVFNEWSGNGITPGAGIPNNVIIQNGTTVNMPNSNRGLARNLEINSGGLSLNGTSGDIFVAGNWTRNNTGTTFTPNNRAVFFNGTANQTITMTGGGTETFAFLFNAKPSGDLIFNSAPATSVTVNGSAGTPLGLVNTSDLDLNGQVLSVSGTTGNINVSGGVVNIKGGAGSLVSISNGTKTVTSSAGGTLVTGTDVVVALNSGINFGSSLSTIQGTLQIALGGFVQTNPPTYAVGSTLRYFTGAAFGRGPEWSSLAGPGYPHHVVIDQNSTVTTLDLFNGSSAVRRIAGNLTINNGAILNMNGMSNRLEVLGNATIGGAASGTLALGTNPGADVAIAGNLTRNTGGVLTQNGREVEMNGSSTQDINGITSFSFLAINNTSGSVRINGNTSINNRLRLAQGSFNLNGFNLTMAANSEIRREASGATMTAEPILAGADQYDVRYTATMTSGNEFVASNTRVRDVIIENSATLSLSADRTFNRDLSLNTGTLDLVTFTMTARGRTTAPAFSGSINVSGGGTRLITGAAGSRFDFTGLNGNSPIDYTKTVSSIGGTLLNFDSNVLVRIGDGAVDFGAGNPTTINGVLQVLLGGSVGQLLNPCFFGTNSILRFANTVDYQVNANDKTWNAGAISSGLPGIPFNVEILDVGTDLELYDTRALRGNLTITNAAFSLMPSFTGSFNIGGNWTRSGAVSDFEHNDKKVVFDGLTAGSQFITVNTGVTAETFYDLEVSMATGNLILAGNLNVLNELNFTSGRLNLDGNTATIGTATTDGSIVGYSDTRYIIMNGGLIRMRTNTNATYNFPMGDNAAYTPFDLSLVNGGQVGAFIDGSLTPLSHPNLVSSTSFINRYWTMVPSGLDINPEYNVVYRYAAGDEVGIPSSFIPTKHSSLGWISSPGSGANAIDGTAASHDDVTRVFTWDGLTTFSDFTGAGDGAPLPIELLDFNAVSYNDFVDVTWVTATEINNHYFTVERSIDAINFLPIGRVDGAGNSIHARSYQLKDMEPIKGLSYYRLRQTDFNGDTEVFDPVAVFVASSGSIAVTMYPNPAVNNSTVSITGNELIGTSGLISIIDLTGRVIFKKAIELGNDSNSIELGLDGIAAGKYLVRVDLNKGGVKMLPLIIQR